MDSAELAEVWERLDGDDLELRRIHADLAATWDTDAFVNNLERYWKRGKGAARIRWGTPGDWTRCHRFIRKHVGSARAKRICAQWHRDTTGMWPGDKRNR